MGWDLGCGEVLWENGDPVPEIPGKGTTFLFTMPVAGDHGTDKDNNR
jgi:hypothetical protein